MVALPVISAVALGAGAGPAAAAQTIEGSGVGAGYSTVNETGSGLPTCLRASRGSYVIDIAEGGVTASDGTSTAVYAGELTVTISLGEFYFNPAGVFSDPACASPGVAADISVGGSNPGVGSVTCGNDSGTFYRVNTSIEFNEVGKDGDGSCTVTGVAPSGGSATVTVSPLTHAFTGNEYPCLDPPGTCPDPLHTAHVQGEWTVTGTNP